jgi:molybdopterin synthase sulfur carrier subunit
MSGPPGPVRVVLPHHLRVLAGISGEVHLDVPAPLTQRRLLDALEARHPHLRGTMRNPETLLRRPFVRFYACELDLSQDGPDEPLPDEVAEGREAFHVVGAMAGG